MQSSDRILEIIGEAKRLALEYRRLTGKPLGITGEVAEYEAARILGIQLSPARQEGYDATESIEGRLRRLQIKGRCLLDILTIANQVNVWVQFALTKSGTLS